MADFDDDKKIKAYLEEQAVWLEKGIISQQEYNDAVNDAKIGIKGYTAQLRNSVDSMKKSFSNLGSAIASGEQGSSVYNDSIEKSTAVVGNWAQKVPVLGNALSTVAKSLGSYVAAVNKQADALYGAYKDLSRSGLSTGMDNVFTNLQSMGYTMKEIGDMQGLLKTNAAEMANFGGTAVEGAKRLTAVSKAIQFSEIGTQFRNMGMNTSDINEGIAMYVKNQQLSGSTLQQNDRDTALAAAAYIEQQDKLTKLTGMSAQEQQDKQNEAMAEQQWAITQYKLKKAADAGDIEAGKKYARNQALNIEYASKFDAKTASAFRKFASGSMRSKEAQAFSRTFQTSADMFRSGVTDHTQLMDASFKDSTKALDNFSGLASAGLADGLVPSIGGLVKSQGTLSKSMAEAGKTVKDQQDLQKAGKGVTGSQVEMTQAQINATQSADELTNVGIRPVTWSMSKFAKATEGVTGILGRIVGREGRVGGGGTWTGGASSNELPAGGAAPAGGAPQVTPSPPPATGAQVDSFINFGGNTGDLTHFKQLNPTVISNFVQMAQEYFNSTGKKLQINSAYRSPEEQASVNSGTNPKAAPGKSLHNIGKAIDINSSQVSDLQSTGLLGKYGFSPLANDPPHIQMPSAATGGVLSGPTSGYTAMLHGNEAVVPLPDGKTIPVQGQGGGSGSKEQVGLLTMELNKLDTLLNVMQKQADITQKILQRQS